MGKFICFEGISGSGKSTLVEYSERYLHARGEPVQRLKFPTGYLREEIQEARSRDIRDPRMEAALFARDYRALLATLSEDAITVSDRS